MEPSPLVQQSRPDTFQPKIVKLYESLLFDPEYSQPTDGFWRVFFLLPPERAQLSAVLNNIRPDDLLHIQSQTQKLFARAVREAGSENPAISAHALETLTLFLISVLTKKYTNPSSDVIIILAGLNDVDHNCSEFVSVIDGIVRNGQTLELRLKAIEAAMAMVSGAYKTSLVSYFIHRDLFPSLMKFVNDSAIHAQVFHPFLLLGLLANYNKFEFQNPYQLRLDDFVNEATILKIVKGIGAACSSLRNSYIAVQDDLPEGWTWSSTLAFFSFGFYTPGSKPHAQPQSPEEMKKRFGALPSPEAAILLPIYDFIQANKLFGFNLVSASADVETDETPFASFLSLTSYLLQHAYRSTRAALYAHLNLFSLRIVVEDSVLSKLICNNESKTQVRLCRQRAPHLPLVSGERNLATIIFDILVDTINHNLRRGLDTYLYSHTISILFRLLTYASSNKIRFSYHWSELWRSLLTLTRFLTTYASDLTWSPRIQTLTSDLTDLLMFCISAGDTFLPDPSAYDDLFYKVVEANPILVHFRGLYKHLIHPPKASNTRKHDPAVSSNPTIAINGLIDVSSHFHSLLFLSSSQDGYLPASTDAESGSSKLVTTATKKKRLSPREVHRIIKEGYPTLDIRANDDLYSWEKWREADWKPQLKSIARTAVEDAKILVSKPEQEQELTQFQNGT
ncbi:hypothetical protein FQN57_001309 [Myotisia sp. PD_48]|nr:hypothetical protein FQN57_001309 [Myotisia sp. PD_48]